MCVKGHEPSEWSAISSAGEETDSAAQPDNKEVLDEPHLLCLSSVSTRKFKCQAGAMRW